MMRKPSCLISCSHWPPEGNLSVFVGRHGAINPAGRVRCNMRAQLKLCPGYCNPNCAAAVAQLDGNDASASTLYGRLLLEHCFEFFFKRSRRNSECAKSRPVL